MSIENEISRILGARDDSFDAVWEMGGIVPSSPSMDNLANAIRSIPLGSSSVQDVKVNGVSVVNDGVANIVVPTPTTQTITIPVASWSNKVATVSVTGVTATNLVQLTPLTKADSDAWSSYGIFCTTQGAETLTFTCESTPTSAVSLGVVIW